MALTVLITGATGGLGKLVLAKLASRDQTVVFAAGRTESKIQTLIDTLKLGQGSKVHPVELEVTSDESIAAAKTSVEKALAGAPLDVLVVNAGIQVDSLKREDLLRTFEVNAVSPIVLTEAFKPLLEGAKRPAIINISSDLGSISWKLDSQNKFAKYGNPGYGASKAALNRITAHYTQELPNFRVVSVNPGFTEFNHHSEMAQDPDIGATTIYKTIVDVDGPTGRFIGTASPSAPADIPW